MQDANTPNSDSSRPSFFAIFKTDKYVVKPQFNVLYTEY